MPNIQYIPLDVQAVFEASEAIARGGDCPSCGASWRPVPHTATREMNHAPSCCYLWAEGRLIEQQREELAKPHVQQFLRGIISVKDLYARLGEIIH